MKSLVIAFAGNPNVGKTALINAISGAKLKIGNWPGVTVEKKEASFTFRDYQIKLIDLPGIYSLTPYTLEERIAQEFLLEERPDVIVDVVDVTNLERNLYLTTQLMELEIPMVMALNMWDEFKAKGWKLDIEMLSAILRIPCVTTSAVRGEGIKNLLDKVIEVYENYTVPLYMKFPRVIEEEIEKVMERLKELDIPYPLRWTAIKILEKDTFFYEKIKGRVNPEEFEDSIRRIEEHYGDDAETVIAEERFGFINGLVKEVLRRPFERRIETTDVLDKIFLNRILGLPIFLFLFYLVFKFTFDGSAPFIDWVDGFINGFVAKWLGILIRSMGCPDWIHSLLIDGVLSGIGLILSFVPLMFFLYFFMSLLEESGYMARIAFLMDKIMHLVGLHGKSFIPMVIGFGCNVPAILATRVLENERDRRLTALLIPFMSCSARLPIYALFTAVFFRRYQAKIVLGLYVFGLVISLAVGFILEKFVFKGQSPPFIMELPPYRIPTVKMLWTSIWLRTRAFIKKAGTVIAASMVVLWCFINLPYGTTPDKSVLGKFARSVSFVFKPLGFGNSWQAVAALIPGTVAKEVVVASLGQLYGVERKRVEEKGSFIQDLEEQLVSLKDAFVDSLNSLIHVFSTAQFKLEEPPAGFERIRKDFTPVSALSYMVFCLLWLPCIATLGALYSEFGKQTLIQAIIITTITPYIASFIVYNLGTMLFH